MPSWIYYCILYSIISFNLLKVKKDKNVETGYYKKHLMFLPVCDSAFYSFPDEIITNKYKNISLNLYDAKPWNTTTQIND
jgi:hypothetical protein